MKKPGLKAPFGEQGFTLIEIVIVVALLAVLGGTILPALSGFFSSKYEHFKILTGIIARTYDDAFLRDRINYLVIHIDGSDRGFSDEDIDIFQRRNGFSVVNYKDGRFTDNERKTLSNRKFPDNFRIEAVLLNTGEPVRTGNVLIPFYPNGFSDNVIIHILADSTEQWSVRIYKHLKEPDVVEGFITHEGFY